ncbi:Cro/Cl family transcriptional regulator [Pseudomonas sp. PS1]|uniref:Cro/Cl family transcriptional regulator n=1 Tax=Stutzerimonas marianensis TaxID=2929513 RepID=A0A9X2ARA1_9GAMM|nr:LexA family transcriptional regulator [Pseudomonas marianensis]MCJ0972709.1 Cro/Cl family transcriptional regulator [Pseudomonas marianensis]
MIDLSYQLGVDIRDQLTVAQAACNHQPMVASANIREAFTARLNKALDEKEGVRPARGRNVDLCNGLRSVGVTTTTQATSKWLRAESIPEKENMRPLASWLGVNAQWLEYGDGPMRGGAEASNVEPGPPIVSPYRAIPIVGTAQMGTEGYWYALDEADGVVDVYSRDAGAYALRLKGNSMAPAIKSGWIAVIEPNNRFMPGEYVMVRLVDGECMLKELLYANDVEVSLASANDAYDRRTIPIEQVEQIHAVGAIVAPSKVRV